jgi:hypothetical protein
MASAAVASPLDGEVSRHGEHQLLLQVWNPPSAAPLPPMHDTTLLGWKSLDSGGCDHRQLKVLHSHNQGHLTTSGAQLQCDRSFTSQRRCASVAVGPCGVGSGVHAHTHVVCQQLALRLRTFVQACLSDTSKAFSCLSHMPTIMLCALRLWHSVYPLHRSFSHAAIMNLPCPRTWIQSYCECGATEAINRSLRIVAKRRMQYNSSAVPLDALAQCVPQTTTSSYR